MDSKSEIRMGFGDDLYTNFLQLSFLKIKLRWLAKNQETYNKFVFLILI